MPENVPVPSPARAVYGYSAYLLASTLGTVYVLWALLPTDLLGLHYLPDKYLSLCLPNILLVGFTLFIVLFLAVNMIMTPEVDDLASVVDLKLLGQNSDNSYWQPLKQGKATPSKSVAGSGGISGTCVFCNEWHGSVEVKQTAKSIPALQIMDIAEVNRLLFD